MSLNDKDKSMYLSGNFRYNFGIHAELDSAEVNHKRNISEKVIEIGIFVIQLIGI